MISVVDYGVGNLHSVAKALEKVGADIRVTSDWRDVEKSDGVVLPGVGAFKDSMDAMQRFQQDQKLEPTGRLTARSLVALGLGPKPADSASASPPAKPPGEASPLQ